MKVIGIVGLPGSGKGECSRVAEQAGILVVTMGDVIRKEVKKAGLPPSDKNMGEISQRLRKEQGMGAIARACIPVIEKLQKPNVLVDGIRGEAEVHIFKNHFPHFVLIAIHADNDVRLSRLQNRKRSDDCITMEDLAKRDERETAWGLLNALAMADITLSNNGSLEEFEEQIKALFSQLVVCDEF